LNGFAQALKIKTHDLNLPQEADINISIYQNRFEALLLAFFP
jgi:hypothetical protein